MTKVKFSPMSRYVAGQDRPVYGKYGSRFSSERAENGDLLECRHHVATSAATWSQGVNKRCSAVYSQTVARRVGQYATKGAMNRLGHGSRRVYRGGHGIDTKRVNTPVNMEATGEAKVSSDTRTKTGWYAPRALRGAYLASGGGGVHEDAHFNACVITQFAV